MTKHTPRVRDAQRAFLVRVGGRWDDDRVALDPAWIGVIGAGGGAAIGAFGSALVEWAKVATQGKQQRLADAERRGHEAAEAKAQREADAAEKEAQRQHETAQREREHRAAERTERVEQMTEWREGLAAAHIEYEKWWAMRNADSKPASVHYTPEPNSVSAPWFQSLRRHLSSATSAQLRSGDAIQCDNDMPTC